MSIRTKPMYMLPHVSLFVGQSLYVILAMVMLLGFELSTTSQQFVATIMTFFLLQKSVSIFSLLRARNQRKQDYLYSLLSLDNIIAKGPLYQNHLSLLTQVIVHVLGTQYFLFSEGSIIYAPNSPAWLVGLAYMTAFSGFIESTSIQLILFSNVNDIIWTVSVFEQFSVLCLQSVTLLSLESIIVRHYFSALFAIKSMVAIIIAFYSVLKHQELYEGYVNQSSQLLMILLFFQIQMPFNYMPFTHYFKGNISDCLRNRSQFKEKLLKYGRMAQSLFVAGYVLYIGIDRIPIWMKCLVCMYIGLTLIYIVDLVYRRISDNHQYLILKEISMKRLSKVMETSKEIRYLEAFTIKGVRTIRGRQDLVQFQSKVPKEMRKRIFDYFYWSHPQGGPYRIVIADLIQIYQPSSAFVSELLFDEVIDSILGNKETSDKYLMFKEVISHERKKEFFNAVLQRLFRFGHHPNLPRLISHFKEKKYVVNLFSNFQSCMLTTIVFNTKLAPDIPIHPTALYYDLYSDLD